jgi:hypothetical protein
LLEVSQQQEYQAIASVFFLIFAPVGKTDVVASASRLCRKFKNAVKRQKENQSQLAKLLAMPNPFEEPAGNYTVTFFQKQWTDQRGFRSDHTDEEQEQRDKLIQLYEHRSTLDVMRWVNCPICGWLLVVSLHKMFRARLLDPKFHLLSKKEVKKVFDNIKKVSDELEKLEKELSAEDDSNNVNGM